MATLTIEEIKAKYPDEWVLDVILDTGAIPQRVRKAT